MSKPSTDLGLWDPDASVISEPSVGKKASGFQPKEKPPAQYFNWYWKGVLAWLKWLYTISVDTATSITSFNINKGDNVTNSGTNTNTINCSESSIDLYSSDGTVSDSTGLDIQYTTNFSVKGCSNGIIEGYGLSAENSSDFTLKGYNNSLKNCKYVTIPDSINYSSMENLQDTFTEIRDSTKTLKHLRLMGRKILKKVFYAEVVYLLGNASQNIFGNRYLSEQAELYWHGENVLGWRYPNLDFTNVMITGGQASTDGLFGNSVELVDSSDIIEYPILPIYDEDESHTFSFWFKITSADWTTTYGSIFKYGYGDTGATYGWTISGTVETGFSFVVYYADGISTQFLPNLPIKQNVYQNICVIFNYDDLSYTLYIDSVLIGTLFVDSIVGDGTIALSFKAGNINDDTSRFSVNVCEVTQWANTTLSPLEIQKVYSGGLELSTATQSLFANSEISVIQNSGNETTEAPKYLGNDDWTFVYLKFPDWMKNPENATSTTIAVYSELYYIEDF